MKAIIALLTIFHFSPVMGSTEVKTQQGKSSFRCSKFTEIERRVERPYSCDDSGGYALVTPDMRIRPELHEILGGKSDDEINATPEIKDLVLEAKFRLTSNMNAAKFTFQAGVTRVVYRGSYQAPEFSAESVIQPMAGEYDAKSVCMQNLVSNFNLQKIVHYDELDWPSAKRLTAEEKALFLGLNPKGIYWEFIPKHGGDTYQYKFKNVKGVSLEDQKRKVMDDTASIIREIEGNPKEPGNVFIHCYGGHHRTSIVFGVLQKCLGQMSVDDVLDEYKCHIGYENEQEKGGYHPDNEALIKEFPCDRYFLKKGKAQTHHQPESLCAMDIGSGETRFIAAKIFPKFGKLKIQKLDFQTTKVSIRKSLVNGNIPTETQEQLKGTLLEFKKRCESQNITKMKAVATAGFRFATGNGKEVADRLTKETEIPIQVITGEQEAYLGFLAAKAKIESKEQKIVVWDIGGGTIEFSTLLPSGKFIGNAYPMGVNVFKERLDKEFGRKGDDFYPLAKAEIQRALEIVEESAKAVSPEIRSELRKSGVQVIGLGGVVSEGLPLMAGGTNFEKVEAAFQNIRSETLGEMKARFPTQKYTETLVTNLILIYGYMKEMQIKDLTPMDLNLADGLMQLRPDQLNQIKF